jgi:hypothetical protein
LPLFQKFKRDFILLNLSFEVVDEEAIRKTISPGDKVPDTKVNIIGHIEKELD